jgi:hypothetical protein
VPRGGRSNHPWNLVLPSQAFPKKLWIFTKILCEFVRFDHKSVLVKSLLVLSLFARFSLEVVLAR